VRTVTAAVDACLPGRGAAAPGSASPSASDAAKEGKGATAGKDGKGSGGSSASGGSTSGGGSASGGGGSAAQVPDFPVPATVGDVTQLITVEAGGSHATVTAWQKGASVPGRGAGIFLHVNGGGATAGRVSVPRATMDRFMSWISPSHHPRIAIG
jgi:hypothetical protein